MTEIFHQKSGLNLKFAKLKGIDINFQSIENYRSCDASLKDQSTLGNFYQIENKFNIRQIETGVLNFQREKFASKRIKNYDSINSVLRTRVFFQEELFLSSFSVDALPVRPLYHRFGLKIARKSTESRVGQAQGSVPRKT